MPETRQRPLIELAAQRPELQAWLHPLRVSLDALQTETFRALVPLCAQSRAAEAPMLQDATIPFPANATRAHVHAVMHAAFGPHVRVDALDSTRVLELAIAQESEPFFQMADDARVDAQALIAAAQLAALPVLIACARSIATRPVTDWTPHHCHVCGALPIAVEVLGLERARQLRCGRCGASWGAQVLLCSFCGERDHARLASLVPEGPAGQICWLETCTTCRGYIKTRAALRPCAADTLMIEDARSIELDLTAHERGYHRPDHGHFATRAKVRPIAVAVG